MNAATKRSAGLAAVGIATAGIVVTAGTMSATAGPRAADGGRLVLVGSRSFDKRFGPVQLAGEIGDFGKTEYVDASGKPSDSNSYLKAVLQHGTVTFNVAKLEAKLNNPVVFSATTCSGEFKASAAVPISGATGRYAGAHGTLTVTLVSNFLLPRRASGAQKGQCNGNAKPRQAETSYIGAGRITP